MAAAGPDAEAVASPSLNGRRPSASRFSFEKAIGNGDSTGPEETAAVVDAVSAEVDAQVAHASTAALQATADVAKQAKEVAATSEGATASSADKLARKAAEVSEKAAGVAATAAKGAAGNGAAKVNGGEDMLLRRPSVKDRVAALESPVGAPVREGSLKKTGDEQNGGERAEADGQGGVDEEAALAAEDWARAEAVEASLRKEEARQREADAHRVGKEAEEARRYEAEYREQRQRVEEYKRKEEEKKKEQVGGDVRATVARPALLRWLLKSYCVARADWLRESSFVG